MKEAIRLLRRQAVACTRLDGLLGELGAAIRQSMDGRGISEIVQRMEAMFGEFSRLEGEQRDFLKAKGQKNMVSFVQAQPASMERDVAMRLLLQTGDLQKRLSRQIAAAGELLQRSQEFVAYHINVHSKARASGTYGPPGEGADAHREKIFDANV